MIFATKKGRVDCFHANDKFINYLKDRRTERQKKKERETREEENHTQRNRNNGTN